MAGYLNKYHIGLNSKGYVLSIARSSQPYYQKKRAPTFVNKFGSGDVSYRDSTFWQYWASTNWRNGAKQLRADDPGKFWNSENINITQLDEISLSKALTYMGQTASGIKNNVIAAWRSSQSWWNASYGYRQQLTITAPAGAQVPTGYPVKITVDTAALQTASKLRSDRNDWRVVYFNGTSWVDLKRDYISTTVTFFGLQAAIPAGASDSNYYIYYGYSGESSNNQPTTEADWNAVYGMFGLTPDSNSKAIYHFKEGSGSSVSDDSASTNTGATANSPSWGTDGLLGRYLTLNGANQYVSGGNGTDFELGSMTLEAWIYPTSTGTRRILSKWNNKSSANGGSYNLRQQDLKLAFGIMQPPGGEAYSTTVNNVLTLNTWQHVAVTYDGSSTPKIYVDGTEQAITGSATGGVPQGSGVELDIGRNQNDNNEYFAGRIQHARVSNVARASFPYALSPSNQPSVVMGSEATTQPPTSAFDMYVGGSNGKLYKHDGASSFSEEFDFRRIQWFETGADGQHYVGDNGGTEKAVAQSFQVPASTPIKAVALNIRLGDGSPNQDITVRIETNSGSTPSGTLVDSALTATIAVASVPADFGWVTVEFPSSVQLSSGTTYWIVIKTAAMANANNYLARNNSAGTYSSGNVATSNDGGSTWTAQAAQDLYFRVLGNTTSINDILVSSVGGTRKMLIATGEISSQRNGEARLYSYDGTNYALEKIFATATESQITKLAEYNSKLYAAIGPQAKIYEGTSPTSWTISKDIDVPQKPGYIYALKEYNGRLYAGGGSPEFLYDKHYNGFWYVFDGTTWFSLYPFDFTELRTFEFYDAYLFGTTYHGQIYVYDTATLNPLFNFKDGLDYQVSINNAQLYDDKIYFALYPQDGTNDTNVGVWVFDRHGLSLAHKVSGVTGYRCMAVVNNTLMIGTGDDGKVYKLDLNNYTTQGYLQTSYFDANLPSIDKLYNAVTVQHEPLASGQSVKVYYRFKESDSWTLLGTSDTVASTEKTLTFTSGVYSKKISLKIELNTSDTAATPRIREYVLQYTLYPVRKWLWTMRIKVKSRLKLLDKTNEARTVATIRSDLESLVNSYQLITFVDIDGTSYSVLPTDLDQNSWVLNQADVNEDEVAISLLEA